MQTLLKLYRNETLKVLADAMPVIVWMADAQGQVEFCNKKWYEVTGFAPGDDITSSWESIFHRGDLELVAQRWKEALHFFMPFEMKYRFANKLHPQAYRWYSAQAVPMKNNDGITVKWIGICTDIDDLILIQDKLAETNYRFQIARDGAGIGTWDWNVKSNEIHLEGALKELYGFHNNSINLNVDVFMKMIHPDDYAVVRANALLALANESVFDAEFRFITPEGKVKWLSGKGSVFMSEGKPVRVSGIHIDITSQHQVEQELQENKLKLLQSKLELQSLTDNLPDLIVRYDLNKRYLFVNQSMAKILRSEPDKLIGKSFYELNIPCTLCKLIEEELNKIIDGKTSSGFEYYLAEKDKWYSTSFIPEYNAYKKLVSILSVSRNITDYKKSTEQLLHSREQLKLIADTAPVYIAHCDTEERLNFVNVAYAARFGLKPEDCMGKKVIDIIGEDAYAVVGKYIKAALAGVTQNFEAVVPYRGIGKQYMQQSFAPEFDSQGNVVGLVAVINNITARRQAEQALERFENNLSLDKAAMGDHKQITENLIINHSRGSKAIRINDIEYLEALQGYCIIHLHTGESIMSSKNLSDYEELLTGYTFIKTHRSYLINMKHFNEYVQNKACVVLSSGTQVPVSRRNLKVLNDYLRQKLPFVK